MHDNKSCAMQLSFQFILFHFISFELRRVVHYGASPAIWYHTVPLKTSDHALR